MLKKKKHEIMAMLEMYQPYRDDDMKLLADIWSNEVENITGKESHELQAIDLLGYLYKGLLTSPETIIRVRRKVQEQYPELRGEKWKARHRAQESVKEELRNF